MTAPGYQPILDQDPVGLPDFRPAEKRLADEVGPVSEPVGIRSPSADSDVQKTKWFIFVAIIVLLLVEFLIIVPASRLLADPDLFWHTATGRLIWTSRAIPQVDEFSFTFRGHPWIARDWLSDLVFYGSYSLDGWRGLAMLTAGSIALTFGLLFLVLARTMRVTIALCVAMVMIPLSMGHLHARPQLLADPLLVIWVAQLVRAVDTKTLPSWFLLPLMALWANVHGGFIVGLGLGFCLAGEALVEGPRGERLRLARGWGAFLLAAVGAACLTPYGWKPLFLTFDGIIFGNEAMKYIMEYDPVNIRVMPLEMIFLLAMMFAALLTAVKIRPARLVLITALTIVMLGSLRYMGPYNLVIPLFLAAPLCAQFPSLSLTRQIESQPKFFIFLSRVARIWFYPLCAAILLIPVAVGVFGRSVAPDPKITPEAAVDYIVSHNDRGNVYAGLIFGGYLTFREVPSFIDGRTDQLFLDGFIARWFDVSRYHPKKLAEYLDEYKIEFALLEPDKLESEELAATPGWRKVYSDSRAALFEREAQIDK